VRSAVEGGIVRCVQAKRIIYRIGIQYKSVNLILLPAADKYPQLCVIAYRVKTHRPHAARHGSGYPKNSAACFFDLYSGSVNAESGG
jgi:hypothetical protein